MDVDVDRIVLELVWNHRQRRTTKEDLSVTRYGRMLTLCLRLEVEGDREG